MLSTELVFDPTDASTQDASANVGAWVRAGDDGTLIGHVSDALKTSITNASIAVTATNLDIRDLVFASDKVDVSGSSNVAVTDGGGSLTVDAVNLDIRDLAAASDAVSAWTKDGAGNSIGSTGGALNVFQTNNSDSVNGSFLASVVSADDSGAKPLPATSLPNRKLLSVQNKGTNPAYLGGSGVTVATGTEITKGGNYEVHAGPLAILYAICDTAKTANLRVLEAA